MSNTFTLPMLEWVDIPAGRVTIEDKKINYSKEHYVEAFSISKYPVTYAQFQAFIDAQDGFQNNVWWQGLSGERVTTPGSREWATDEHPRDNVSWYDAVAFCRWLGDNTGLTIYLPTEQQWQRAAQGDDGREYPWGNAFDSSRCNTMENGINRTTIVDQYPNGVSPYGVYDMAGNVWEWCLNSHYNPENTDLVGSFPRVLRGGSWSSLQAIVRCTHRHKQHVFNRYYYSGFRMVIRPPST
jgi:formylglycine-generating enzyme required for sulfatase activity